jgi:hypothetical protein
MYGVVLRHRSKFSFNLIKFQVFIHYHFEVTWPVVTELLISILIQVEEEKASLQSQCADQQNDLGSLRKELLQAEQTRLDLESDKVSLQEKVKFLEIEKEKVSTIVKSLLM